MEAEIISRATMYVMTDQYPEFQRIISTYADVNGCEIALLKTTIQRIQADKDWPQVFKDEFAAVLKERPFSPQDYERLTNHDHETEAEVYVWLQAVWNFLYEDMTNPDCSYTRDVFAFLATARRYLYATNCSAVAFKTAAYSPESHQLCFTKEQIQHGLEQCIAQVKPADDAPVITYYEYAWFTHYEFLNNDTYVTWLRQLWEYTYGDFPEYRGKGITAPVLPENGTVLS